MTHEPIRLGTRATITRATGIDAAAMLALARESAPDPTVFETHAPFFWQVKASSNRLDFYHTRMRAGTGKTLDNFVRGLKDGVSYQDSHNPYKNGWGQSLDGRSVTTSETDPDTGEQIVEVWGDFFTLAGLQLGEQNTNDFTAAIRAGVWRDVSVGFYASDIECGLCGKQAMDWWSDDGCRHIPGVEYEIPTGDGSTVRMTAWAWINDGELAEVSQVYEGASPGAGVVKAEQMSLDGALPDDVRMKVERQYQVRIAQPQRRFALGGVPLIERHVEEPMPEKEKTQTPADPAKDPENRTSLMDELTKRLSDVEGALQSATDNGIDLTGVETHERVVSLIEAHRTLMADVASKDAEIERLTPIAADGERYKADLVDDTIASGVRAYGEDFDEAQYRADFEGMSLDSIRRFRDLFEGRAAKTFTGGRITTEVAGDPGEREDEQGGQRRTTDPERYKA